MSGTWASTLLPTSRSARRPALASSRARLAPKNRTIVGTPWPRHPGDVQRRLDPKCRDPARDEIPKEITIVASHLDDKAVRGQAAPADHRRRELCGVGEPRIGIGREIGVLAEDRLGSHVVGKLREQAGLADLDAQRVERLHLVELVRPQEALAQRRHAEVDDSRRSGLAQNRQACTVSASSGCWSFTPPSST